jgi:hypothetical protein
MAQYYLRNADLSHDRISNKSTRVPLEKYKI